MRRCLLLLALATLMAGCAPLFERANRPLVSQGNLLSSEEIAAIETGMTRAEVRQRIGGPVVAESFHADRWDYVFYETRAGGEITERQHLRLHFEGDLLVRIEDNYEPPDVPEPDDTPLGPEPDPMAPAPGAEEANGAEPGDPAGDPF